MGIEMSRTIEEKNKALVFQDEVTEEQSKSKAPVWNNLSETWHSSHNCNIREVEI